MSGPQKLYIGPMLQGPIHEFWNISMPSGRMNTKNGKCSIISNLPVPQQCRIKSLIIYDQDDSFFWCPHMSKLLKQINQPHHLNPENFELWVHTVHCILTSLIDLCMAVLDYKSWLKFQVSIISIERICTLHIIYTSKPPQWVKTCSHVIP